jgi:hypothetical protein
MPKLTGVAVNLDVEGRLHVVASSHAEGPGATMWHAWQAGPGAPEWSLWQPFGEPGPGGPGAPTMYQDDVTGQLGVLVVSSGDQAVWHRRQAGGEPDKWSDWESLGQPDGDPVQGPVATTLFKEGQFMAVVVAAGAVWQTTLTEDPDEQWSAWSSLGQPDVASVRAVSIGTSSDGQCELVALVEWPDLADTTYPGDSSVLWHRRLQAGNWSEWEPLIQPAGHSVPVGTPVLSGNFFGDLELFTRTSDGAVWRAALEQIENPGAREPWAMLVRPGYSFGDLAVALDSAGRMLLVAPTSTGNHLWYALQSADDRGATWSPLSPLSVVPEASAQDAGALTCPVLLTDAASRMQLYVVVPATGIIYHFTADEPGQLPTIPEPFTHPGE